MTKADKLAADRVLKAAVKRATAMTRNGEPRDMVAAILATATTAAAFLLDAS